MKDILGYEGLYAITSCGRVWSHRSKKFLNLKEKPSGYKEVCLSKDGCKKTYLVHRLVAETYIPNPKGLPHVGHKDEGRSLNSIINLYWTDAKQNCNMPLHLMRKSKSQINNNTSKKALCVETGEIFPSLSEASRACGCSPQNIYRACQDANKTACGFHWEYSE